MGVSTSLFTNDCDCDRADTVKQGRQLISEQPLHFLAAVGVRLFKCVDVLFRMNVNVSLSDVKIKKR